MQGTIVELNLSSGPNGPMVPTAGRVTENRDGRDASNHLDVRTGFRAPPVLRLFENFDCLRKKRQDDASSGLLWVNE